MDPKNIVAVRFSVRNEIFERKFISSEKSRNRWFKFRAWLFDVSLAASLQAQTVKPVATFLYFDVGDQELVETHFTRRDFIPIYSTDTHEKMMGNHLIATGLTNHVVLSRIDSDDIVEKNYFAKINKLLTDYDQQGRLGDEVTVISRSGFRTNFLTIQNVLHISPPFVSQYFRSYAGQGAYFNHTKIGERAGPRINHDGAEWMQIIHGTNVANKFKPPTEKVKDESDEMTRSIFGPTTTFDAEWFFNWAGIEPISPKHFGADKLPLEGLSAKARHAFRRLLGQA